MKTCDVCKKTDNEIPLGEGQVDMVRIGMDIGVFSIEEGNLTSDVRCDLCQNCLVRVNSATMEFLKEKFGLLARS